jgi:hypothetical protein
MSPTVARDRYTVDEDHRRTGADLLHADLVASA